jgi:hypothetical protein
MGPPRPSAGTPKRGDGKKKKGPLDANENDSHLGAPNRGDLSRAPTWCIATLVSERTLTSRRPEQSAQMRMIIIRN